MTNEPDLFGELADQEREQQKPLPRQRHSKTSTHAAESMAGEAADTKRQQVLRYIVEQGETGCTDEEGIKATKMNPSTWRPRRIELCDAGDIIETKRERLTLAGRPANVYVAKQFLKPEMMEPAKKADEIEPIRKHPLPTPSWEVPEAYRDRR